MTVKVETYVKFDYAPSLADSNELMNKTMNMFNLILMLVELSKDEKQLRFSMNVMRANIEPYFMFGFGYGHMWVKQIVNKEVLDTRLLIVEF